MILHQFSNNHPIIQHNMVINVGKKARPLKNNLEWPFCIQSVIFHFSLNPLHFFIPHHSPSNFFKPLNTCFCCQKVPYFPLSFYINVWQQNLHNSISIIPLQSWTAVLDSLPPWVTHPWNAQMPSDSNCHSLFSLFWAAFSFSFSANTADLLAASNTTQLFAIIIPALYRLDMSQWISVSKLCLT